MSLGYEVARVPILILLDMHCRTDVNIRPASLTPGWWLVTVHGFDWGRRFRSTLRLSICLGPVAFLLRVSGLLGKFLLRQI